MEHAVASARMHLDSFDRLKAMAGVEDCSVSVLLKRALCAYAIKRSGSYMQSWEEKYGTASPEMCKYILGRARQYQDLAKEFQSVAE